MVQTNTITGHGGSARFRSPTKVITRDRKAKQHDMMVSTLAACMASAPPSRLWSFTAFARWGSVLYVHWWRQDLLFCVVSPPYAVLVVVFHSPSDISINPDSTSPDAQSLFATAAKQNPSEMTPLLTPTAVKHPSVCYISRDRGTILYCNLSTFFSSFLSRCIK
jgi:hypothetical protein